MAVWILQHMDERWFSKFFSNSPEPGTPGKFHETERRSGWQSREGSRLHVYNLLGHNFCLLGANPRQRLPRMRSEEKLNITLEDRSILWMNEEITKALTSRWELTLLTPRWQRECQNCFTAHLYCAACQQNSRMCLLRMSTAQVRASQRAQSKWNILRRFSHLPLR